MSKKIIIVVDDSQTVRQEVAMTLSPGGFEIIEAADGVDGARAIERTPEVALVICDVNMPRMNGLEMVETVKRNPKFAALPIVMLTTEGQPELIERAKKAGAKGWLVKPFKPEMLLMAVRKLTGTV